MAKPKVKASVAKAMQESMKRGYYPQAAARSKRKAGCGEYITCYTGSGGAFRMKKKCRKAGRPTAKQMAWRRTFGKLSKNCISAHPDKPGYLSCMKKGAKAAARGAAAGETLVGRRRRRRR